MGEQHDQIHGVEASLGLLCREGTDRSGQLSGRTGEAQGKGRRNGEDGWMDGGDAEETESSGVVNGVKGNAWVSVWATGASVCAFHRDRNAEIGSHCGGRGGGGGGAVVVIRCF